MRALGLALDADAIDEDVEPAKRVDDRIRRAVNVRERLRIHCDAFRRMSGLAKPLRKRGGLVGAAAGNHNARAC